MKTALFIFIAIGSVFLLLDTGLAIKCFVCNSFHQADCADWFDNVTQHLVNCPGSASKCRKVVQEEWSVRTLAIHLHHTASARPCSRRVFPLLMPQTQSQCMIPMCQQGPEVCAIWLDDHWDVRYIRQCAQDGEIGKYEGRSCLERYGTYNVRMRYCHCNNQDGCNSAPSMIPTKGLSQFLPFAVTFLAAFVRYLLVGR